MAYERGHVTDDHFGSGRSAQVFLEILESGKLKEIRCQKLFHDVSLRSILPPARR
jgi:hypothetical protein